MRHARFSRTMRKSAGILSGMPDRYLQQQLLNLLNGNTSNPSAAMSMSSVSITPPKDIVILEQAIQDLLSLTPENDSQGQPTFTADDIFEKGHDLLQDSLATIFNLPESCINQIVSMIEHNPEILNQLQQEIQALYNFNTISNFFETTVQTILDELNSLDHAESTDDLHPDNIQVTEFIIYRSDYAKKITR